MEEIPTRILREDFGDRQSDLAVRLGLKRVRVTQLEGGSPMSGACTLRLFTKYPKRLTRLGLSPLDFLRGRVKK